MQQKYQKIQKAMLATYGGRLHKESQPGPAHTQNPAGLPFTGGGGGNSLPEGFVQNVASQVPFVGTGAASGGSLPTSSTGKPGLPFTK